MKTSVNLEGLAIIVAAIFVTLLAWLIISAPKRRIRRRFPDPSGEIQVVLSERQLVTLQAERRMPAKVYLELATRYGKYPETLGLWMAEKMIAADAGKLAELSRVTVDRDPKRDEYVFQLTLLVVPAEVRKEDKK